MPRFRVVIELDSYDKANVEASIEKLFLKNYLNTSEITKIQKIRGKRKPKPNPNQIDWVEESGRLMAIVDGKIPGKSTMEDYRKYLESQKDKS